MSNSLLHYRLLIIPPQLFDQPLLWILNNSIIPFVNIIPLIQSPLRIYCAFPTLGGLLMIVVFYVETTASMFQMLMIFDSRFYNTNMITFYPDTLVKTRHSSLYDKNMYGLNFEPLSSIFAIHARLANALKHHGINPTDY